MNYDDEKTNRIFIFLLKAAFAAATILAIITAIVTQ